MNTNPNRYRLILGCLTIALAACGGGSSSSSSPAPVAAAAPTPQVAKGTVTGFGSVHVNGVEWETDDCEFTIDDEAGDESQLEVGDIVEVEGTIDENGRAECTSMEYDAEVEGLITEVGDDYILVHGLRVEINDDTILDEALANQAISDLSIGDYVEVSAFSTAGGYIATRIDLEIDDGEVEVYGKVENLNATLNIFTIHDLTVNYATATFDDFDGKELEEGDYVEVEGMSFNADDELVATSVEYKDNNPYDDGESGDEFEVEGYLSVDGDVLMLNDVEIVLAANVTFEYGTVDDLVDGVKVEVEGSLNDAMQLVVDEVKFKIESNIEIEAPVDGLPMQDAEGVWSISMLNRSITINDRTQFEDESATDETYFDIEDIADGDWLEVKLFEDDAGNLIAARIEREDPSDSVEVEGLFSMADGDVITVAGFTVMLDDQTELPNNSTLTDFVDSLIADTTELEVEGIWSDGSIMALRVEFED